MAIILGIESTCDETAAAVVVDGRRVLSNSIATQFELHAKYRGVVPEIASRAHIENLLPVITEAMTSAGLAANDFSNIDAIAVAHRPGLIGSLLIGVTAAKTLAWATGKPFIGVDHVHAHLYSVLLDHDCQPELPAVGLVCSGGHTALYHVRDWLDVRMIGSTIDDAVGEAYDKVSAILDLGYPGGPAIDRLSQYGDPKAIAFPRTLLGRSSLDFSFSGLKTSVLYHVRGVPKKGQSAKAMIDVDWDEEDLHNVCASFQAACVDVIVEKIKRALRLTEAKSVLIGGGVSANRGLRAALADFRVPTYFPELRYCTDNAAMSAGLAQIYFQSGRVSDLSLDAITSSQFSEQA